MKIFFKIIFYLALFVLLGFLIIWLFFQEEYQDLKERYFHEVATVEEVTDKTLVIAYAFGTESFDPTAFNQVTRTRLLNIYESLVRTDRNLQVEPSLALSWGRISSTLWEFKLRPDVVFHDGSTFDSDDVLVSFNRAIKNPQSGLIDLLDTIESIQKIDDLTIQINTKKPDPLLINRISTVLMFPSGKKDFENPVGTGSYRFSEMDNEDMILIRNEDYWGDLPYYGKVYIKTIPNRFDRLDAIKEGQVHILANVPPSFAVELSNQPAINILSVPSLEVNFLIFNFNSEILKDKRIREAITLAFDRRAFVDFSNGYARPSYQFVSNGIFGFNPDIEKREQDIIRAKELIRAYDPFKRPSVQVDITSGAEIIGDYIKDQLNEIGVSVEINIMEWEELRSKIFNKESEIYYLGWKSELGDSSSFLENAIHSVGRFNGGNYLNKKVDQLIELSLENLDDNKRLEQLHDVMRIIVEEDIVGLPLFESDVIYGIRAGVHFNPRLDGYILANEIH